MPTVGRACWKCSGTLQAPAGSHPHSPAPGLPDQRVSTMHHSSSQGRRRESWINGTAGRQDAAQLGASCAADLSLRCHGSHPRQALLKVLPFTNKASTEPCTTCHQHCLPAAGTQHILILQGASQHNQPHIQSGLSFTPTPTEGQGHGNTTAEPEQLLALSCHAKTRPCSSTPELAGARLPCWHPELPLAPNHRPIRADWSSQPDTHLLPAFQI